MRCISSIQGEQIPFQQSVALFLPLLSGTILSIASIVQLYKSNFKQHVLLFHIDRNDVISALFFNRPFSIEV